MGTINERLAVEIAIAAKGEGDVKQLTTTVKAGDAAIKDLAKSSDAAKTATLSHGAAALKAADDAKKYGLQLHAATGRQKELAAAAAAGGPDAEKFGRAADAAGRQVAELEQKASAAAKEARELGAAAKLGDADQRKMGAAAQRTARDVEQLGAASRKAEADVDKVGKRSDAAGKLLKIGLAAAAGFAAKKLFDLAQQSITAASDLAESTSKVGVVFGDVSGQINDFAKTSAKSLGISEQQAKETAGTFGNLFVAMKIGRQPAADMSVSLIKLAADLASFNNKDPTEVLEALRSGLVGETEPLRVFGINLSAAAIETEALSLGLATSKDTMTDAAKAQAAYSLIMAQSTTAQGDFVRTSTGLANQQRIMAAEAQNAKAALGEGLLPAQLALIRAGNDLMPLIQAIAKGIAGIAGNDVARTAVLGIAGITLALKGLSMIRDSEIVSLVKSIATRGASTAAITAEGVAAQKAAVSVGALAGAEVAGAAASGAAAQSTAAAAAAETSLEVAAEATGGVLANRLSSITATGSSMRGVTLAAGGMAAAFVGSAFVIDKFFDMFDKAPPKIDDIRRALRELADSGAIAGELSKTFGKDLGELREQMLRITDPSVLDRITDFTSTTASFGFEKGGNDLQEYKKNLEGLDAALTQLVQSGSPEAADQAFRRVAEAAGLSGAEAEKLRRLLPEYSAASANAAEQSKSLGAAGQMAAGGLGAAGDKAKQAKDPVDALRESFEQLTGRFLDQEAAASRVEDAFFKVTESVKENGTNLDIHTEKGRANREMIRSAIEAIIAKAEVDLKAGYSADDVSKRTQALTERFYQNMLQAGFTREQVQNLQVALHAHPRDIATRISQIGADEVRGKIDELKKRIEGFQDKDITLKLGAIWATSTYQPNAPLRRAAGGRIAMGTGPTADDVPIWGSKGEYMVNAAAVSKVGLPFMDWLNAQGYARGGSLNVHSKMAALPNVEGHLTNVFQANANSILGGVASFGGGAGGAARWAPLAAQVLAMLGQPASHLGAFLRRINFESGGNPNAINLTDSNARAGHPSQGLGQTIPSTFNAYAGPFRSLGITNPLANLYASAAYAVARYGSVAAVDPLIRPRGYARGGLVGAAGRKYAGGGFVSGGGNVVYPWQVSGDEWDRLMAAGWWGDPTDRSEAIYRPHTNTSVQYYDAAAGRTYGYMDLMSRFAGPTLAPSVATESWGWRDSELDAVQRKNFTPIAQRGSRMPPRISMSGGSGGGLTIKGDINITLPNVHNAEQFGQDFHSTLRRYARANSWAWNGR